MVGSTFLGADNGSGKTITVRYLPFKPAWNIRGMGPRVLDLFIQLMICLCGLVVYGVLEMIASVFPESSSGMPGSTYRS